MRKFDSKISLEKMENLEGSRALFHYATEGIIVADSKGEIQHINPSAEKLFGYQKGELIGKKVEILIPTRFSKNHEQHRNNYNKNPHSRSMGAEMELSGMKKDGTEFPVEISLSPFSNVDGNFVIAFIIDISIRKKAESALKQQKEELQGLTEELKKSNVDLEQKVKSRTVILEEAIAELEQTKVDLFDALAKEKDLNELKTRFVSMASHEFRTPLATILSSLSLVTKYGEQDDKEKQSKHIAKIKSSIGNLTDILNDFLSVSKLEEGKVEAAWDEFNLNEFVSETVSDLKAITKEGQTLHHIHNGSANVHLDKKLLKNILFNLISNAIKFSRDDGKIEIKSEVEDSKIILSVKDSGIGISEADQRHLFERFFRGHNATNIQGTGLGLNIVAKYTELMDGTIDFTSEENKGTTFTLMFPQ